PRGRRWSCRGTMCRWRSSSSRRSPWTRGCASRSAKAAARWAPASSPKSSSKRPVFEGTHVTVRNRDRGSRGMGAMGAMALRRIAEVSDHAQRQDHSRLWRVQESQLLHEQEQAPASRARGVEEALSALQQAHAAQGNQVVMPAFVARLSQQVSQTTEFIQEVRTELRKVTWPDRAQLRQATIAIIIFVLLIAGFIAILDLILQGVLVRGIPSLFGK